jgi:hypothetical protein
MAVAKYLRRRRRVRGRYLAFAVVASLVALATASCGGSSDADSPVAATSEASIVADAQPSSETAPQGVDEQVPLVLEVYIVDGANGDLSSRRTASEVAEIMDDVADIWAEAGVIVAVETVERLDVSDESLTALARTQLGPFFADVSASGAAGSRAGVISAFFVRGIGGPNGIAPSGTRSIIVVDNPSVHDERVTAHEIGHVLALHHTLDDSERLLFPGTNGMTLTAEELFVANYAARGYAEGAR